LMFLIKNGEAFSSATCLRSVAAPARRRDRIVGEWEEDKVGVVLLVRVSAVLLWLA
jgi:hypothetical protein